MSAHLRATINQSHMKIQTISCELIVVSAECTKNSTRIFNQSDIILHDTWKINVHILDLDSKETTLDSNADTFVRSSWISLWRASFVT